MIYKEKIVDCKSVVVDMSYFGFVFIQQDAKASVTFRVILGFPAIPASSSVLSARVRVSRLLIPCLQPQSVGPALPLSSDW